MISARFPVVAGRRWLQKEKDLAQLVVVIPLSVYGVRASHVSAGAIFGFLTAWLLQDSQTAYMAA